MRHKLVCKFNNNQRTETDVMTCVFNEACPASLQKKPHQIQSFKENEI